VEVEEEEEEDDEEFFLGLFDDGGRAAAVAALRDDDDDVLVVETEELLFLPLEVVLFPDPIVPPPTLRLILAIDLDLCRDRCSWWLT